MRMLLIIGFFNFLWVPLLAQEARVLPAKKVDTLLTKFEYLYENQTREVPVKVYFTRSKTAKNLPVVIMSHGLGGTREIGSYLGMHWANNGFVVVAMQHEGSDRDILKDKPRKEYVRAFRKAMSMESFLKRVHDVPATIDQIGKWNADKSHWLYGKFNMRQIGMCGHSFGALTTQAVSGQSYPMIGQKWTDPRIKAAFAMSPSSSRMKRNQDADAPEKAFGKVSIPWLLMTGTKDKVFLAPHVDVENRKLVFKGLPAGGKYQLVLDKATHMAFSDNTLTGGKHKNPKHHEVIQEISTAFFRAYLANDKKAKSWLESAAVERSVAPKDTWSKK